MSTGCRAASRSMQTYDRMQAAFPGEQFTADVVVEGRVSDSALAELRERARESDSFNEPVTVEISPDGKAGIASVPLAGSGTDQHLDRRGQGAARGRRAGGVRRRPGGRRDRLHRRLARLQRRDGVHIWYVLGVRLPDGVHAAAGDVQVDRDPDQGDPAQPAVGGRGARNRHLGVPGRPLRGLPELPVERIRQLLVPADAVRDPVRPLDGLPRVHPEPDQGGLRPRRVHRRRHRPRHQVDRGRGDRGGAGDGRRCSRSSPRCRSST